MHKRILIVSQYFYPESFRINELAFELAKLGHHVDVLTAIPNYPDGKFYKGYGIFRKRKEVVNGVTIYRCLHSPRGKKASNLSLSINYLTFMITASLRVLFQFAWKKKYDAIIGFQMSPITQVVPGCLLGSIRKSKVLTWVQDIWPDSITDNIEGTALNLLLPPLKGITEYVYRHSDKLLITSIGMSDLINRYNDYCDKIEYVPNWCDDFLEVKEPLKIEVPSGFNIMMAGNLGEGIGPEEVINAIKELSDNKDINFLFVGGGSRVDYMKEKAEEFNLTNIYFLGKFPYESMGAVYNKADALLLTLMKTDSPHLDVTVPSRLQAYMSSGKPIFAMIGSGAKHVINKSKCGLVVPAGDYKKLASIITDNYKNNHLLAEMGKNARTAYESEFTIKAGVNHFEELINM